MQVEGEGIGAQSGFTIGSASVAGVAGGGLIVGAAAKIAYNRHLRNRGGLTGDVETGLLQNKAIEMLTIGAGTALLNAAESSAESLKNSATEAVKEATTCRPIQPPVSTSAATSSMPQSRRIEITKLHKAKSAKPKTQAEQA